MIEAFRDARCDYSNLILLIKVYGDFYEAYFEMFDRPDVRLGIVVRSPDEVERINL